MIALVSMILWKISKLMLWSDRQKKSCKFPWKDISRGILFVTRNQFKAFCWNEFNDKKTFVSCDFFDIDGVVCRVWCNVFETIKSNEKKRFHVVDWIVAKWAIWIFGVSMFFICIQMMRLFTFDLRVILKVQSTFLWNALMMRAEKWWVIQWKHTDNVRSRL